MFTFASTTMALGDEPVLNASFDPLKLASYYRFVLSTDWLVLGEPKWL